MCGRAGQRVMSHGLGSAPALSVPPNALSAESAAQPRAFLLASREFEDKEVFCRNRVPQGSVWEPCTHQGQGVFSQSLCPPPWDHGCCKQGTRTLCCTHRAQNSPGETFANPALFLDILHQSLHQQTSQPCLPLVFSFLGSWAVQSPMVSACWHLTRSHCALVGRVLGCSRVVTFHGRVQQG